MNDLVKRAIERAAGIAGLPEGDTRKQENPKGSNWGHPVQDFLASVDLFFPASWCMAFMYWCFKDAAGQLGLQNPLVKTGGCLAQWHGQDPKHQVTVLKLAQPGDIFIMDHGHGVGHTGIIEDTVIVGGQLVLHTIEGNTNDTGSREGYEVIRKTRKAAAPIIGYLRF